MSTYCILALKLLFLATSLQGQQLFLYPQIHVQSSDGNHVTTLFGLSVEDAVAQSLNYLTDNGFYDATIDSVQSHHTNLNIFVTTGPRYEMVVTLRDTADVVINAFSAKVYSTQDLQAFIQTKLDSAEKRGYPFAEILVTSFEPDTTEKCVRIELQFITGEQVWIQGIRFNGLRQLSSSYLLREAAFSAPEIYAPDKVAKYRQRIQSSIFIESASEPYLEYRQGKWWLVIDVRESSASYFDVILGYNPSAGASRSLVGRGGLELRNFISEGSVGGLDFERMFADRSRLEVMFSQYWVLGLPLMAGLDGAIMQQDSTWYSAGVTISTAYHQVSGYVIGIQGIYTSTQTAQSSQTVADANYTAIRGFVSFDDTNQRFSPTSGTMYRISAERGVKSITTPSQFATLPRNYAVSRYSAMMRTFFEITPLQVLTPRLLVSHSSADVFLRDDLYRLGGHLSLRGYNEEQFEAISYAWGDLEYRFRLDDFSYIFGFGAAGVYAFPSELARRISCNVAKYFMLLDLEFPIVSHLESSLFHMLFHPTTSSAMEKYTSVFKIDSNESVDYDSE